jgi:hypothetical protein
MVIFRLVFGGLLLAALLCFGVYIGTGDRRWLQRGLLVLKWTVLAGLGFFVVIALERLTPLL